jgi:hypothetical protein
MHIYFIFHLAELCLNSMLNNLMLDEYSLLQMNTIIALNDTFSSLIINQ